MSQQLTFPFPLPIKTTFNNFIVGKNTELIEMLQSLASGSKQGQLFLWGAPGVGLSHLLQATAHAASDAGQRCLYLSATHSNLSPDVFDELEALSLVIIDNIEAWLGQAVWEEALFALYNTLFDAKKSLIIGAHHSLQDLPIRLPDLRSRISAAILYHIKKLSDEEKIAALKLAAYKKGMLLKENVSQFILTHGPRDWPTLLKLLDELENASLVSQRKITIPFVKEVLQN